jgi:ABC-2 type transport system permease protein
MNFDKLIAIQSGNVKTWIAARLAFYTILLLATICTLILLVALKNNAFESSSRNILSLIFICLIYIIIWTVVLYFIILKSMSSRSIAFKMISVWIIFCVLIPGAVHQTASIKYPANYMTDYLDANRKETYEMFELSTDTISTMLKNIYPKLANTKHGKDTITNDEIINNSGSALVNQLNKRAIQKIEIQNDAKNNFIASSYWYNPITMIQNKWNSLTGTDYSAYKNYRSEVQKSIDKKIELLVFECWDKKTVYKKVYENYFKLLK